MEKAKRKEREFNLRRTEILEAAVKVFAAKGFHNATVAEIAAASGFAIGTLYQFFESKEQLYTAMLTEKLAMMYAGIRAAVEEETDRRPEDRTSGRFPLPVRRRERRILQHLRPGRLSVTFRGKRRAPQRGCGTIMPSTSPSSKR